MQIAVNISLQALYSIDDAINSLISMSSDLQLLLISFLSSRLSPDGQIHGHRAIMRIESESRPREHFMPAAEHARQ
jgi:hypothetical protein